MTLNWKVSITALTVLFVVLVFDFIRNKNGVGKSIRRLESRETLLSTEKVTIRLVLHLDRC